MRDMTLEGFLAHIATASVEIESHEHHAMERAAKLVEKTAKDEIGHYQLTDTGQFVPWEELHDRTKDDRVNSGWTENDPGLRSGKMRDSIEHSSDHKEANIGSNDDKLVWFELGTDTQSPRSVLGVAAHRSGKRVAEIVGSGVVKALVGEGVVDRLLPIP